MKSVFWILAAIVLSSSMSIPGASFANAAGSGKKRDACAGALSLAGALSRDLETASGSTPVQVDVFMAFDANHQPLLAAVEQTGSGVKILRNDSNFHLADEGGLLVLKGTPESVRAVLRSDDAFLKGRNRIVAFADLKDGQMASVLRRMSPPAIRDVAFSTKKSTVFVTSVSGDFKFFNGVVRRVKRQGVNVLNQTHCLDPQLLRYLDEVSREVARTMSPSGNITIEIAPRDILDLLVAIPELTHVNIPPEFNADPRRRVL